MLQSILKISINAYRHTPLHPHLTGPASKILAAVQGEKIVQRRLHGFDINLDTSQWIDSIILNTETFEPETMKIFQELLKPGMSFVDVGANIGWFSLYAATLIGESGKITAYEPSDWTFDRLRANIQLNGFANISARRAAVGQTTTTAELVLPCGYRLDRKDTATKQRVDIVALDDDLDGQPVDLIKIDTDGFEIDVINGAKTTIENHTPNIIFEVMTRTDAAKTRDVTDFLRGLDYRIVDESMNEVHDAHRRVLDVPTGTMNLIALSPRH